MSQVGGHCVFASEWDKYASAVYTRNFGIIPRGDITKIGAEEIPSHDMLCGGFPCQAFSISGSQKGFEDSRGTLFFDIVRIIDYHQPRVLLLENVKNLLKHDNGRTFKVIRKSLDALGYNVFYKVLNATSFGLPQNRERLYIVGFRKDLDVTHFTFDLPPYTPNRVVDILEERPVIQPITRKDITFNQNFELPNHYLCESNTLYYNRPFQIGKVNKGGKAKGYITFMVTGLRFRLTEEVWVPRRGFS